MRKNQFQNKTLKNIKKLQIIFKQNNMLKILVKKCKCNHLKEIYKSKFKQLWNNKESL